MSINQAMPEKLQAQIFPYLAPTIKDLLVNLPTTYQNQLEEIRLRMGKPLCLHLMKSETFITGSGKLTRLAEEGYRVKEDDITRTLAAISGNSIYALEEELRRGFITIRGGHRVGLAGKTIVEHGQIKSMKEFSTLAIRIARELPGCSDKLVGQILDENRLPYNTLIVSPPRCGKTTILRDLARQLSRGLNIVVIDERSEIAGCFQGEPQLDVGPRTDVLEGCPKAMGIVMAIRALSPQVLITDEIGRYEDVQAVEECLNAGVRIITTAHASSLEDLKRRPVLQKIFSQQSFHVVVILSRRKGPGTIEKIVRLSQTGG
ncbi:MAG: stage III sporulation protein AA [Syntrophomonadales bacterium]|jgi:stage III sporulation protein AA